MLNFWASWCGPCRDEMPLLQAGSKRWQGKNVVFVGVDAKDFRGDARAFLERYGVTYPNVYDGKGSLIGRYGVTGYPGDVLHRRGRQGAPPDRRPRRGAVRARRGDRAGARAGVTGGWSRSSGSLSRCSSSRRRSASEQQPTPAELESELVCPVCETTLDTSDAPVARRMKAFIRERIAAGDTKSEIKA